MPGNLVKAGPSLHGSTNLHSILYTHLTTSQESFLKSKTGIWTGTNFQEWISMAEPVIYGMTAVSDGNTLKDKGLLCSVSVQFMDAGMCAGAHSHQSRRYRKQRVGMSFREPLLLICGPISKAYRNSAGRTRVQSTSLWVGVHFRFKL